MNPILIAFAVGTFFYTLQKQSAASASRQSNNLTGPAPKTSTAKQSPPPPSSGNSAGGGGAKSLLDALNAIGTGQTLQEIIAGAERNAMTATDALTGQPVPTDGLLEYIDPSSYDPTQNSTSIMDAINAYASGQSSDQSPSSDLTATPDPNTFNDGSGYTNYDSGGGGSVPYDPLSSGDSGS